MSHNRTAMLYLRLSTRASGHVTDKTYLKIAFAISKLGSEMRVAMPVTWSTGVILAFRSC